MDTILIILLVIGIYLQRRRIKFLENLMSNLKHDIGRVIQNKPFEATYIFIGEDLSCGYKNGQKYTLEIHMCDADYFEVKPKNKITGSEGIVAYSSTQNFFNNWKQVNK